MKIKNIKINNYGKLENKEINLENKINIIYGKNESGKSTLLNYIKNIFYGISKNKNGKEISDYEKFKPWLKEDFSGKIKYELDNGKKFEIFRDFNKKNPKIFNENLEEISQSFNIDKKDGVQFFYEQTKVDETTFLSTVVSMQEEVKLDKQSQAILVQKLANLAGTGDDNTSFKKVLDKLNKRQVEEIGTDRTQGKPINIIKEKIKNNEFVIKEINLYQERKKELEEKKKKIKEKINELELENNIIKKINEINSEINLEKEKINLKNKIKNENEEKINNLNTEKNNLLENKKIINLKNNNKKEDLENKKIKTNKNKKNKLKYFIIFFILLIIFIGIKLINKNYLKNNFINILNYFLIPIYLIIIFIKTNIEKNNNKKIEYENKLNEKLEEEKIKNEIIIIDTKIDNVNKQIENLKKEKNNQIEEIKNIQLQIDNKIDTEIEKIKNKYKDQINTDNILDNLDFENIKNQLIIKQEELNKNKLMLNTIEIEENNITSKLENVITLKTENENLNEKLQDLEEENRCINLTKEYLNRAYEKMKNSITPKFTENLSKNIAEISNQKYSKVTINDENGLVVENQFGQYIPADRLSIGTIDQLYLSLRLSMVDDISNETMPIILDEAFAYYDEIRLENILKFLVKKSEKNQLIIFTCTKREQEILNKLGVQYNLVELS